VRKAALVLVEIWFLTLPFPEADLLFDEVEQVRGIRAHLGVPGEVGFHQDVLALLPAPGLVLQQLLEQDGIAHEFSGAVLGQPTW
jgi:hypothetical protein